LHFPTVRRRRICKGAVLGFQQFTSCDSVRVNDLRVFRVKCRRSLGLNALKISCRRGEIYRLLLESVTRQAVEMLR
jgi:hypothetical protein